MRIVTILQARFGSTRLPGKILADLGGASLLARMVRRTGRAKRPAEVAVATTDTPGDEPTVAECARLGVPVFRGSAEDVLDRYRGAAAAFAADAVIRICADSPFSDPEVIDEVAETFLNTRADYVSNCHPLRYPLGMNIELITRAALEIAAARAEDPAEREHVTPYLVRRPEHFKLVNVPGPAEDYSACRWTVDCPADLALARAIYERLGNRDDFAWREALAVLTANPELARLNQDVPQHKVF